MTPSKDISRLIQIMAALRDPRGGCPWDLEQDFATIAPYTVEEAYEVVDAIERDDAIDLREELGDLLLQVVYHAQIAAERGLFDFGDVVETITTKMIRRHPHVFGDEQARSARSAKGQWERIKAQEKTERAALRRTEHGRRGLDGAPRGAAAGEEPSLLDTVPAGFPALKLAQEIQKKVAGVGFDWGEPAPIYGKINEEIGEFRQACDVDDRPHMEEEIGDLLFSVVNLSRFYRLDAEAALRGCATKFRRRFDHIETALSAKGRTLRDADLSEMNALWDEAKIALARSDGTT